MKRKIISGTAGRFQEARDRLHYTHVEQLSEDLLQFIVDLKYSKEVSALLTADDISVVDNACTILGDLAVQLLNTPGFN